MASTTRRRVVALVMNTGVTTPGAVTTRLQSAADAIACPADSSIYDSLPAVDNGAPPVCPGGVGYDSFNGHGQVNALAAV
jgi:hypothetical protein